MGNLFNSCCICHEPAIHETIVGDKYLCDDESCWRQFMVDEVIVGEY